MRFTSAPMSDLLGTPVSWQELALCRQVDPEIFFPLPGYPIVEAQRICSRCEVTTDCLAYALANGIEAGVWGGMAERERRKLRRRRTPTR